MFAKYLARKHLVNMGKHIWQTFNKYLSQTFNKCLAQMLKQKFVKLLPNIVTNCFDDICDLFCGKH